ncbi:MAG TPA: multidrug transporter, partial [Sphingobacterium sp.]|nr:multidrug transporter [Sphingobacterium sp.]
PDNATGNFVKIVQRVPVRIELDKQRGAQQLLSGMNVNVSVSKNQN